MKKIYVKTGRQNEGKTGEKCSGAALRQLVKTASIMD